MRTRIALFTAVNVSGRNKLSMAELRGMAAGLGFELPRTLLQSGNLVFGWDEGTDAEVEALLEEKILESLELKVDCHVRSVADFEAIVAANPYPQEALDDPSHLVVVFFKSAPNDDGCEKLRAWIPGREYFTLVGREMFMVYPDGIGESKLTKSAIDSRVRKSGTARNWNTVLKLLDLARAR